MNGRPINGRMVLPTPIGPLTLVASSRGLRAVLWSLDDASRVPGVALDETPSRSDEAPPGTERAIVEQAAGELEEYLEGTRRSFEVPLDPVGTAFQRRAWAALRTIPYGETVTYGEQAERLGDRRKARAVGAANGRNPISIIVPCHRVVGSNGALTGFAGGLDVKAWLLDHERFGNA
jgi:methylated-DNA-[protein]-cysteine S-methyltransferase